MNAYECLNAQCHVQTFTGLNCPGCFGSITGGTVAPAHWLGELEAGRRLALKPTTAEDPDERPA